MSQYEIIRFPTYLAAQRTFLRLLLPAPWNIVYMPKMLDPFTGYEAQGELIDEYTDLFQRQGYQGCMVYIYKVL